MSGALIPYTPREGREIVLRHRNAIVVRDPSSKRLEIRGTECPTCHQPLRAPSPDRQFEIPIHHDTYIDPDYFRMLRAGNDPGRSDRPPPSPRRRLVRPLSPTENIQPLRSPEEAVEDSDEVEFVSSTPAVSEGNRIRRDAFSPNYFKTFFVEEEELGRGGKGVVLLVRHEIDGCNLGHFACKRVPVGDNHAWLERVLIEVQLLSKLSHPNLVSYRHVWLEDFQATRFVPSVACAFILQQYCNSGDLHRYIVGSQPREATKEELKAQMRRKSKGQMERPQGLHSPLRRLALDEIYSLFKDITSGLAYLHAANYIHRDLKPSNCLLHREAGNLVCLISDFGEVQAENAVRKSTGSTGTISYCAPEVLKQDANGRYGNFTTKSDIFSLGMILYFMCFGRLPYQHANALQEELEDIDLLRAEITDWQGFQDERRERPDLPSRLYQLLKKLLSLNPVERPSANEVLAAMKGESGIDSMSRGQRSGSPSIGHRIQNLDSPIHPSTPVPDPTKQSRAGALREELNGSFSSSVDDNAPAPLVQKHQDSGTSRYRAHAMAPSRSQDGHSRTSHESISALDAQQRPTPSPPLLMPPPTTLVGEMRHKMLIGWLRTKQVLNPAHHGAAIIPFIRIVIFLAKMMVLVRPCWPFMASLTIAAPLVALAAMDLAWLPAIRSTTSVVVPSADRGVAARRGSGGDMAAVASRGGLRTSLALLGFHLVVVWVAMQWGALCAAQREHWGDW